MKGFKTIVWNIVTGILLVVENQGVGFGLSPEIIGYVNVVGNFILRLVTTTGVFKSK